MIEPFQTYSISARDITPPTSIVTSVVYPNPIEQLVYTEAIAPDSQEVITFSLDSFAEYYAKIVDGDRVESYTESLNTLFFLNGSPIPADILDIDTFSSVVENLYALTIWEH